MKEMDAYEALIAVRELPQTIKGFETDLETLRLFTGTADLGTQVADPWVRGQIERRTEDIVKTRRRYTRALLCALRAMETDLAPEERRVVWLFYIMGKSNGEIADMMHMDKRCILRKKRDAIEKMTGGLDDEVYSQGTGAEHGDAQRSGVPHPVQHEGGGADGGTSRSSAEHDRQSLL